MNIAYHYTIGDRWECIRKDGLLKQATALVPKNERPAVWCTVSEEFDPTARKFVVDPQTGEYRALSIEETAEHGGGLVRIAIDKKHLPLDWKTFVKESGIEPKVAAGLRKRAYRQGVRISDWCCSFDAIPRENWGRVEFFQDGKWIDIETVPSEEVRERETEVGEACQTIAA